MKGYKAFEKGLICKDKRYWENTVFEENEAEVCRRGIHFCINPLDTLNYYSLIDDNCELSDFAEVEALDEVITDNEEKYCTKKLRIGAKLDLKGFIEASFDFLWKNTNIKKKNNIFDFHDDSKIATSGDSSKVATSGDSSQVATSGYRSKVVTSGNGSQVATSGDCSQVATSGDYSQVATSGYRSQVATSGYRSQVATSGDCSQVVTSEDRSRVATVGDCSQVAINGMNNVGVNIGVDGIIKGKKGNWITLAEYDYINDNYIPVCVKSAQIDGVVLKEDIFYKLENGEFMECN